MIACVDKFWSKLDIVQVHQFDVVLHLVIFSNAVFKHSQTHALAWYTELLSNFSCALQAIIKEPKRAFIQLRYG